MMEGEAVEIFAPPFKSPQPKVARMALKINLLFKMNRALALPPFKFRRANPTSDPSLDFFVTFLIKQKSKSPSAASRGKPVQRKNSPYPPIGTFP
ncbi:hypothetical protein [Pedobacter sp. N23S346]|uniref:hypothetical protein n=1 Tax=Pedobacter sp. N23S346 TaxID=3402750 RepID=UPI003ABF4E99